jgi:hypothetical protein
MCVRYFLPEQKTHMHNNNMISLNHVITPLQARILYASGGIYVRAIFFAGAKNTHAQ